MDKVNMTIGRLTEDNLVHCVVAVYEELTQGYTVMEEANGNQHSFQLATCGIQIGLRGGRGWEGEGRGRWAIC